MTVPVLLVSISQISPELELMIARCCRLQSMSTSINMRLVIASRPTVTTPAFSSTALLASAPSRISEIIATTSPGSRGACCRESVVGEEPERSISAASIKTINS
ncbi:hypothetical protein O6H91_Y127200 [Diphasiastrum complanatum]|nr:hypothetical protein O6H91_Y127200 [Diphasiastrum complanatum]